jgi:hypothetical protein
MIVIPTLKNWVMEQQCGGTHFYCFLSDQSGRQTTTEKLCSLVYYLCYVFSVRHATKPDGLASTHHSPTHQYS